VEKELNELLKGRILEQETDQYKVFYDQSNFTFNIINEKSVSNGLEMTIRATAPIYILEKEALSKYLGTQVLNILKSEDRILIENIDEINFNLINYTPTDITLTAEGQAKFVWIIDELEIKNLLANTKKAEVDKTISNINGISKIITEINPFWGGEITENIEKIKVKIVRE